MTTPPPGEVRWNARLLDAFLRRSEREGQRRLSLERALLLAGSVSAPKVKR